ncbi:DUF4156 domain-containing protein [Gilvimarinus sp. DA14]|uniref:DUF4156 domain-containing protein n=1 Tax=Gilvimarinus sp. DA14 TaxID=2956798 RepID=UPI0020B7D0E0|nr:DUF4156 domain-containing protein [Gilvimarinus sp. DA14]UTF58686.1 DUF4156 domain-containing protein [Gilvimarinus sp. DA14]
MRTLSLAVVTIATLSGCTWVDLKPEAQSIAVARSQDIANCKQVSHVTANVMDGVAFLDRNADKVAEELTTIARNEAVRLGGDTVVPSSSITDGSQHFTVYQCGR